MTSCLGKEIESPTKRSELSLRWPILALLCFTLLGDYYVYDIPTAVEQNLAEYFLPGIGNQTIAVDDDGVNTDTNSFSFRYNLLYAVYSWPNVILPFFGGIISDKLGVRLTCVIFMILISIGTGITSFGCSLPPSDTSWYIMWLGRTIFGFGGESLSVAASAMVAQWFSGKELAFALGVNLALARIGSVINDAVSVQVATHFPVYWSFWVGTIVCVLSTLSAIITYYLDMNAEDKLRKNLGLRPAKNSSLIALIFCLPLCRSKKAQEDEMNLKEEEEIGGLLDEPPKEEIHLSSVFTFPLIFWVLCLSCVTVYIAVLPFNSIASGFIAQKWLVNVPLSQAPASTTSQIFITANSIMLTTYLVAGFLAPVMGAIIDRVGYRAGLNLVASGLIISVHALLAFTMVYPVAPLLLLGVGYSIYAAALWPSIALVIEPQYHGTAYGVATAIQNLGLAAAPMIIGLFMPSPNCPTYDACVNSYKNVELILIGTGLVGFLSGVWLNFVDCTRKDGIQVLNWTSKKVEEKKKEALENGDDRKPLEEESLLGRLQ